MRRDLSRRPVRRPGRTGAGRAARHDLASGRCLHPAPRRPACLSDLPGRAAGIVRRRGQRSGRAGPRNPGQAARAAVELGMGRVPHARRRAARAASSVARARRGRRVFRHTCQRLARRGRRGGRGAGRHALMSMSARSAAIARRCGSSPRRRNHRRRVASRRCSSGRDDADAEPLAATSSGARSRRSGPGFTISISAVYRPRPTTSSATIPRSNGGVSRMPCRKI